MYIEQCLLFTEDGCDVFQDMIGSNQQPLFFFQLQHYLLVILCLRISTMLKVDPHLKTDADQL
jgi:hypothetical protein